MSFLCIVEVSAGTRSVVGVTTKQKKKEKEKEEEAHSLVHYYLILCNDCVHP